MNDNQIQYFTKLLAKTFLSLIKIYVLGVFSTVFVLVFGTIALLASVDFKAAAHGGAEAYLLVIFTTRPLASILLLLLLVVSPILFIILAKRYALNKAICQVVNEKSDAWILPLLDQSLLAFKAKHPDVFQSIDTFVLHKLRFIQNIKNDTSQHIWKRKIVVFFLKKINLNDVDVRDEKSSVTDIIELKVKNSLAQVSVPSRKSIFILVLIQWLAFLLVWKTNF